MESVYRTGSLEQMVEEESNKGVSRRGFLGMLAGAGALVGLGSKAEAREWSHPLYEVLDKSAIAHTSNSWDQARLRGAILALSRGGYEDAAYNLIPGYEPNDSSNTIPRAGRMKNPGGDNPTYWVVLRLTYEGLKWSSNYEDDVEGKYKIPKPKNQTILAFAKSIIPKKKSDLILLNKKETKFLEYLKSTNLFN